MVLRIEPGNCFDATVRCGSDARQHKLLKTTTIYRLDAPIVDRDICPVIVNGVGESQVRV